jgi:hypothetical protein
MTGVIRESGLKSMSLVAVALLWFTVSVGAQQQAPAAPSPQEAAFKSNVQLFEMALNNAIKKAGNNVADWARQIDKTVTMEFVTQPEVRAVPLPDDSLVFHVDVYEIGMSSQLWAQYRDLQQRGMVGPSGGAVRAGNAPVPDDPIKAPPARMSPTQYFTEQVREGLINTILDSSAILQMRAGQTLTVACNPVESTSTNTLRSASRKLVLTIKGEHLLALQQGTLSRDEAKRRITERRF